MGHTPRTGATHALSLRALRMRRCWPTHASGCRILAGCKILRRSPLPNSSLHAHPSLHCVLKTRPKASRVPRPDSLTSPALSPWGMVDQHPTPSPRTSHGTTCPWRLRHPILRSASSAARLGSPGSPALTPRSSRRHSLPSHRVFAPMETAMLTCRRSVAGMCTVGSGPILWSETNSRPLVLAPPRRSPSTGVSRRLRQWPSNKPRGNLYGRRGRSHFFAS